MAWTRPSVQGPAPSARCAQTTTSVDGQKVLFIFGGWNGNKMLNDLQAFHFEPMTWSKPVTTGAVPGIRAGHTTTAVNSKLYIFGGGDGNHYLNDLHILDTETMAWSQAYVAGTSPAARSRHSTVAIGSKLYVFGGGDDSRVYNDVYVLDTETMAWSRPVIKGTPPVARWGHTGTYIGESKILIFGGHDGQRMLDDMVILDTATMAWISVVPPAKNAEGQPNTGPSARAGHTATLIPGKRLMIFGGGDGSKIYSDSWFFELNGYFWVKPTIGGTPPAGRCAHTSNMIEDQLVIFGGGDGGRRFKDMYIVDIDAVFRAEETKKNKGKKPAVKAAAPAQSKKKTEEKKDITTWLTSIGMKKYAEKFVAQEIDMETVQYLNESHLEQLGITTIGGRLRFMAAIKTLGEVEPKEVELVELATTLKESMDALATSTNRLTEVLKGQQCPVMPVAREKQQNGAVKQTAAVPVTDEGGFSDE